MGIADLLRKESLARRQEIDNETVDAIVQDVLKKASIAASQGKRDVTVDHQDLNRKDIQVQVRTALEKEGFHISFFVDEHEDNDMMGPPCGYTLYCVGVSW